MIFDTHCHLTLCEEAVEEHLTQAAATGIRAIFDPGLTVADISTRRDTLRAALSLAKPPPEVEIFIGGAIAPHGAFLPENLEHDLAQLREATQGPNALDAIGEIGLEYYHPLKHAPRAFQLDLLRQQIIIADEASLPICLHLRSGSGGNAYSDAAQILRDIQPSVPVISHCFTGEDADADALLACGAYLSFSGIVTFKNARSLQAIAARIPSHRLLVETDAPYLAPVPMRGKPNRSPYVIHTQNFITELREEDPDDLTQILFANARKIFPRKKKST